MHQDLKIKSCELEMGQDPLMFLQLITKRYYTLRNEDPSNFATNFTDNQHTLLAYDILYNQVQNGGFLQLIFNGYYAYIFETPLSETLREWGATKTADLLDRIKQECLNVNNSLLQEEKTIELLSGLYKQYPGFTNYDNEFYEKDELIEVRSYVEKNLKEFIRIIDI